jgi:solute:Na+ symporter, SSS family
MTLIDWIVLASTTAFIVVYGTWRSRRPKNLDEYIRGGNTNKWPTIGLGIMATQASAITFLSTPGQAYQDGMRFVQFYFGLPLAMIVIAAIFVPAYYRLKVYTAYEYLEHRFDARVRLLGAILFLIGRGLATGITIYAPAIILSAILGWPLEPLILGIGVVVTIYTVSGGTRAVSITQTHQMVVMLTGIAVAAIVVVLSLPKHVSLPDAIRVAGALDRMNVVSFELDPNSRYNFWSGIGGGFFLALSYFGTDQSQVQRYLSGQSVVESRLGLLFNAMFKIPMQFVILFTGMMVFVFYLFTQPPIHFNAPNLERVARGPHAAELAELQRHFDQAFTDQTTAATAFVTARGTAAEPEARTALRGAAARTEVVRDDVRKLIKRALPKAETKDTDYVFLTFVLHNVPKGLVGLLVAVIMAAAMSAVSSSLSSLGSTTTIDIHRRFIAKKKPVDPGRDLLVSKLYTVLWSAIAVGFAGFASLVDNLIQAVNILGSLFYGTILGLFVAGLFVKRITAGPVFIAALIAQATVTTLFFVSDLGFLWYNAIGCAIVVGIGYPLSLFSRPAAASSS